MTCFGAENETRTRDPNLGKVVLYQLSYFRVFPEWDCKGTKIFLISKFFCENFTYFFKHLVLEIKYPLNLLVYPCSPLARSRGAAILFTELYLHSLDSDLSVLR